MQIKTKLAITTSGLFLVIIGMFFVTWWVSGQQKNDGLIINLAGRQRMLSQKMTKELLFYQQVKDKKEISSKAATMVRSTMAIFNMTLSSLMNSGNAPLSLNLQTTKYRACPKAKEPAYSQLMKVSQIWEEFSKHLNDILSDNKDTQKKMVWVMNNNVPLLKEMNKAVGMMQKQSEGNVTKLIILQIGGVLTGLLFMLFSMITIGSIINKLDKVSIFVKKFGSGDLTVNSDISGMDELGVIGLELDKMSANLKQMFTRISNTADQMNSSSVNLSKISDHLLVKTEDVNNKSEDVALISDQTSQNMIAVAASIKQFSESIETISVGIEQMAETINEIASNTSSASKLTGTAVLETKNTSERINELNVASIEISDVTNKISEISEQTNLLALNASIESARAGEAGKGFAVVANEVKELAKESGNSASLITEKISGIANVTSDAVKHVELISKVVDDVNTIASTIAAAVEEQSVTSKQIAENIANASQSINEINQNIDSSTDATTSTANDIKDVTVAASEITNNSIQVNNSAKELQAQAEELKQAVANFKL